jgi:hypothetical protein
MCAVACTNLVLIAHCCTVHCVLSICYALTAVQEADSDDHDNDLNEAVADLVCIYTCHIQHI